MSRRFQGGESSEILNQSSVKNEDMIQCRHEVGTVNDSDKAIPLSVIQSCPVATCETAGGTAAKVGVVNNFSDFTLLNGREVLVYFASGNTADNPTFNLNNTGNFPLALENQLSTVSIGSGCWGDGVFLHLKYVDITVSNTRIQKWLICGHRIASQSNTQTTYADGQGRTNTVASGNMQSVTSNAITSYLTNVETITTEQVEIKISKQGRIVVFNGHFISAVPLNNDVFVPLPEKYAPLLTTINGVVYKNTGSLSSQGEEILSMIKISWSTNRLELYSYYAIPSEATISGMYISAE